MSLLQIWNLKASAPKQNKTPQIVLIEAQPKFGNHSIISITPGNGVLMPFESFAVLWVHTLSLVNDSGF